MAIRTRLTHIDRYVDAQDKALQYITTGLQVPDTIDATDLSGSPGKILDFEGQIAMVAMRAARKKPPAADSSAAPRKPPCAQEFRQGEPVAQGII